MKITYDREACQGHNRCYMLAPELFDTDDEGYAILLVEGEVPAELEEKARLAADNCPEFAIEIEEKGRTDADPQVRDHRGVHRDRSRGRRGVVGAGLGQEDLAGRGEGSRPVADLHLCRPRHEARRRAAASAPPEDRAAAVEAFLTEAEPLVADGTYLPDAAKGIGLDELAHSTPLTRDTARLGDFADRCDGLSAVVAAHHAVGLDAKTIAIEGFENLGPWIADGVIGHGARLTAISTATGTVTNESGFSLAELNEAFAWPTAPTV